MGRGGSRGGGGGAARSASSAGVVGGDPTAGLTFAGPGRGRVTVHASVARLDASLARDALHVGPGGSGPTAKPGAYAGVGAFVEKAMRDGTAIELPRAGVSGGEAYLSDGRHRFAYFRDKGAASLPVSVARGEAAEFRRRFGR